MNFPTNITSDAVLTMSSREIAELVEKRHDNVKRTIETLADRGVIKFPQSEEIPTATKPLTIYHLQKRDTFVVVAQLSPEFTARLVDRWQELENARASTNLQVPTTAEAFISAFTMISESQKKQVEHDRAIARLSEDVGHLKETQTVLTSCPANAEPITKIRPRMNARYGLSAKVVDAVMRQSPYAPKPAGHVRNSHEDAVNSTYAVYWKKDITMTFDRFVLECKKVTATQYTHPFIEGRFRIEDKRDGHSATVLPFKGGLTA